MGIVLNMKGEDITPKPLTEKEKLMEEFQIDLLSLLQAATPLEILVESLFADYSIKRNPEDSNI